IMDIPLNQSIPTPATTPPAPEPSTSGGGPNKKILFMAGGALLLLLIIGLAAYYFLGGEKVNSSKPVTLTYWGLWESETIMEPLINQYEQDNPHVTINYEQRPIEQHYSTVKSRISQPSASGNAPDIVRVHNSWVPVLAN